MKITYEHNPPVHRAIIEKLEDPRYYSKDVADPDLRGKFMRYGKYHGKRVVITHKIGKPYHGINLDKVFILYGRKTKQDILSTHQYDDTHVALQGLYNGGYADIVLPQKLWREIKVALKICRKTIT